MSDWLSRLRRFEKFGNVYVSLLLVLAVSFMVSAALVSPAAADSDNMTFTVVTGRAGGLDQVTLEAVGGALHREYDNVRWNIQAGNQTRNLIDIQQRKADVTLTYTPLLERAMAGDWDYGPTDNVKALAGIGKMHFHIIVNPNTIQIDSLSEIKERKMAVRVNVLRRGHPNNMANQVFWNEGYGISFDDIEAWGGEVRYEGWGNAAFPQMQDNRLDIVTGNVWNGAGPVIELASNMRIKLLSIPDDVAEKVKGPLHMERDVIRKEVYEFLDHDVPTLSGWTAVAIGAHLSDETVYKMAKALHKHLEFVRKSTPAAKGLDAELLANPGTGAELHPGAKKYYREAGLLEDDSS